MLLLIPIAIAKMPTSSDHEECDVVKEKELLQSKTKNSMVGTSSRDKGFVIHHPSKPEKCFDLPGGTAWKNQKVSIWDCNKNPAQEFQYWGDGTIRSVINTDLCFDIESTECPEGWCFHAGSKVQLYWCDPKKNNQQFVFDGTDLSLTSSIKLKDKSLCIADASGQYENHAALTVEDCGDETKLSIPQLFGSQLRPLSVMGTDEQVCLDAAGGQVVNGMKMIMWKCRKEDGGLLADNQAFKYDEADSTIRFTRYPNMCLDVTLENFEDGGKVQPWECNGQENQKWTFEANQIKVKSKPSLCLGDVTTKFSKEAQVKLTPCTSSQSFHFRGVDSMDCPWKTPNVDSWMPTCGDGTIFKGWNCVANGKGQRLKCPKELPHMCARQKACGGALDFCCEPSEIQCTHFYDGLRPC